MGALQRSIYKQCLGLECMVLLPFFCALGGVSSFVENMDCCLFTGSCWDGGRFWRREAAVLEKKRVLLSP